MKTSSFPDYLTRLIQTANRLEQISKVPPHTQDIDSLAGDIEEGTSLMQDQQWANAPDPVKAQLVNSLGLMCYTRYQINGSLDDINQSVLLFKQALELVASTQRRRASVLSNLSAALQLRYSRIGDPSDIKRAIEAASLATKLVPSNSPESPGYLINLTAALYERYNSLGQIEDLNSAIQSTEEVVAITNETSPNFNHRMSNLATLYQERYSRLGELNDLTKAINIHRGIVTETTSADQNYSIFLNNLGGCILDLYRRTKNLEDLNDAIGTLRRAVEAISIESPYRPGFLNNFGNALSASFQKTGSLEALEDAIRVQREAERAAGGSPLQASFLTSLGTSLAQHYLKTGNQNSLNESVEVCQKSLDATSLNSPKLASRWSNLAHSLMERHKLSGKSEDLKNGQVAYLNACQKGLILQVEVALIAGYNWGEWALGRQAWAEAAEALDFAMTASREVFERQSLRLDQESWLREAQVIPSMACYAQAKTGNLHKAVTTLEAGRTRILAEMFRLSSSKIENLKDGEHNTYFEKYRQAVDRLMQLDGIESDEADPRIATYEARLELSRVIREIQMLRGFEDLFEDSKDVDIESILAHGRLDAVVYIVITSAGALALILNKGGIESVWLDVDSNEIDRVMLGDTDHPERGYLGSILGYIPPRDVLEGLCHWIGEKIIRPIDSYLKRLKVERVCLIPTGSISLLPLSAGQYKSEGETRTWLEDIVVSYSPSLMVLQHSLDFLGKLPTDLSCLVGIANPVPRPENFPFLEFANAEIRAISLFFQASTIILSGEEASVENVVAALPSASYVHFGCHAIFDASQPFNSGLVLSRGERLKVQDLLGKLVISKARLAVLSSCQTAIIDFTKIPEEAIGLPAGFLQAGIPGVISAQWPVNDLSTAMLMIKFYQYHLIGDPEQAKPPMSPAKSLQQAQLWLRSLNANQIDEFVKAFLPTLIGRAYLRKDSTFTHPYYWAGFTLSGL